MDLMHTIRADNNCHINTEICQSSKPYFISNMPLNIYIIGFMLFPVKLKIKTLFNNVVTFILTRQMNSINMIRLCFIISRNVFLAIKPMTVN